MGTERHIARMLHCELLSADMERALDAILAAGIRLIDVRPIDPLTVRFKVRAGYYQKLNRIISRRSETLRVLGKTGLLWRLLDGFRRPVMLFGIMTVLILTLIIPSRICFVRVEGNVNVPSRLIIEKAKAFGVSFWASGRDIRSEHVKNSLLCAIPELSWAGVNTEGCVATISVRERSADNKVQSQRPVSSVVAARDGIVRSITVTKGSALCKTGQAVKAGEVLISGYSDLGIALRVTNAEGEVFAETVRDLVAVIPTDRVIRDEITEVIEKYTLIIGKKRINLSKGSGILDTSCDKMTVTDYLTLPGGFRLPVALEKEVYTFHADTQTALVAENATDILADFARGYLSQQMVAGQITDQTLSLDEMEDCYVLSGRFRCHEMIGQLRTEEIVK